MAKRPVIKAYPPRPARCANCGKRYLRRRRNQRFDTAACRREFNRNGRIGANRLREWIRIEVKKQIREFAHSQAQLREAALKIVGQAVLQSKDDQLLRVPQGFNSGYPAGGITPPSVPATPQDDPVARR